MTIFVKPGQTIFDVALIAYHDAARVYDLLAENSQIENINSDITGLTLTYTPAALVQKELTKTITVTQPNVTIGSGQTLYDIALQYYGGAEYVFDLIKQNNLESLNSDATGIMLNYQTNNTYVPVFFRGNGKTVSTKYPVFTPSYFFLSTEDDFYLTTEDDLKILIE